MVHAILIVYCLYQICFYLHIDFIVYAILISLTSIHGVCLSYTNINFKHEIVSLQVHMKNVYSMWVFRNPYPKPWKHINRVCLFYVGLVGYTMLNCILLIILSALFLCAESYFVRQIIFSYNLYIYFVRNILFISIFSLEILIFELSFIIKYTYSTDF